MKRTAALALALLLAIPAGAAIKWPPRHEHKLDNGLTVVLVPLPNVPKSSGTNTIILRRPRSTRRHGRI